MPAVIALANGTYEIDPGAARLLFDADTTASEVRLIGEGGAELVSTNLSAPLLRVSAGAPPLTLRGLRLRGQLVVDALQML